MFLFFSHLKLPFSHYRKFRKLKDIYKTFPVEPFYTLMHFFMAFFNSINFFIVKGSVVRIVISAFGPTLRAVYH